MALSSMLSGGMGGVVGAYLVRIGVDTKQLDQGLAKTKGQVESSGTAFGKFGMYAQAAMVAAGAAVLKFGAAAVNAAIEAERAMAQTEAVLASTGGAANVTAEEIVGLADSLAMLTGVDDEAIQSTENLLLTFTKVRNEVGEGNDIFNQTTEAILDMATSINNGAIPTLEQLNSVTTMVGKAMQDPVAGLGLLARRGVVFTESQKSMIKTLVAANDVMGAQKIILEELNLEYGGSASVDTFERSVAKLKIQFENVLEAVGAALIPALESLLALADPLIAAFQFLADRIGGSETAFIALAFAINPVLGTLVTVGKAVKDVGSRVDELEPKIGGLRGWVFALNEQLNPWASAMTDAIVPGADEAAGAVNDLGQAVDENGDVIEEATPAAHDYAGALGGIGQAARDAALATALLAGAQGIIGLEGASIAAAEAASRLIDAEQEYADAVAESGAGSAEATAAELNLRSARLDSINAQIGLTDAAMDYRDKVELGLISQEEAEAAVRAYGAAAGLTKGQVDNLIDRTLGLKRTYESLPDEIITNVYVNGLTEAQAQMANFINTWSSSSISIPVSVATGGAVQHGGQLQKQHGFEGLVSRPTLFMAGEAGPERVSVSPSRAGLVSTERGGGQSIHLHLEGATMYGVDDLATTMERALTLAVNRAIPA